MSLCLVRCASAVMVSTSWRSTQRTPEVESRLIRKLSARAFQGIFQMVRSTPVCKTLPIKTKTPQIGYQMFPAYIIKKKLHSPAVKSKVMETHHCKLCVMLRSRVLLDVCPHRGYRSATPLGTRVYSLYQGQQGDFCQSVRAHYKTRC